MKIPKKSLLLFISILLFLIIVYGVIPKQGPPITIDDLNKYRNESREDAGISSGDYNKKEVKKVSDIRQLYRAYNGRYTYINSNRQNGSYNGTYNRTPRPKITPTPKPIRPLPYPRIMINYTVTLTDNLQSQTVEKGYKFVIVALEIKNYGYKYFDAYPTKFRLQSAIEPIINVGTGNGLDTVIPNNSKTKGDLVFKLKYRQARNLKLAYINNSYTIIYNWKK